MAATSKKVFEVFVSKIPWTVASSKHYFSVKYHVYTQCYPVPYHVSALHHWFVLEKKVKAKLG